MKLNLGCGPKGGHMDGFINIDNNLMCEPDVHRDVLRGLPYNNDSVEEIRAYHLIEHLDSEDFIFFFNECHRVLKEGGRLFIRTPHFQQKWAFIDPTHKRLMTPWSFDFFINKDFNSVNAGVTGWYVPERLEIVGGEIQVDLKKTHDGGNWSVQDVEEVLKNEQKKSERSHSEQGQEQ